MRIVAYNFEAGSSPLTRGAHGWRWGVGEDEGLIPAYAGSTLERHTPVSATRAHPRLRGEHGITYHEGRVIGGSSPLTRGAHDSAGQAAG